MKTNDFEKTFRHNFVINKYNEWGGFVNDIIQSFNNDFIRFYVHCFPTRFLSYCHLKEFGRILQQIQLTPDFETYENLNNENEIFDADLMILIKKGLHELCFNIPFSINITKLSNYLKQSDMKTKEVDTSYLKAIINPECFDEFDRDMQYKKQGRDMLENIKAPNPLILMVDSEIARPYLINGNHRVIQAIRDGKKTVNVYIVTPEFCSQFGMTEDYERLYSGMLVLYKKVHGVVKV